MNRPHELLLRIRQEARFIQSAAVSSPLRQRQRHSYPQIEQSAGRILTLVEALTSYLPNTVPADEATRILAGVYQSINEPPEEPERPLLPIELVYRRHSGRPGRAHSDEDDAEVVPGGSR